MEWGGGVCSADEISAMMSVVRSEQGRSKVHPEGMATDKRC